MKQRLYLTFLFSIFLISAWSQNISVKSFKLLQNDMDARVNYPQIDQNGEKCAIIKVVTTEQGFVWEGDAIGIVDTKFETSEYWLYVPHGAKRITIKHPKLGMLRDYIYPISIKEATVYEMQLTTAKITTIVEEYEIPTQWVVITSEPEGADVYINDQHKGQTPWQMEMEEGAYSYRIEKVLYHPEAGKFNLIANEGKKMNNYVLRPNFGYAKITTTPESGATVFIDGTKIQQTTPLTTQRLKSGTYKLEVRKDMFHDAVQEITITDGQTSDISIELKPSFGGYTVRTIPESGATVMLDGQPTNKTTPCTLERLSSGEHTITVRKEWYEPQSKRITVIDGQSGQIDISMQPTFGKVKLMTDAESDIYIDNQLKGKGSWEGKLIAGWHTFEAKKDKHHPATEKYEILINENMEIQLTPLPRYGSLKIQTTPFDATIKLNGKQYGTTPNTINELLVGEYTLTLEKEKFGTINKAITITENQTVSISETLPAGMEVSFTSDPSGADLYIDGITKGVTPVKLTLGFGKHEIKLVNGKRVVTEIINVMQGSIAKWDFDVRDGIEVTISSIPVGAQLSIDDVFVGTTPYTTTLAFGSNKIKVVNGKKVVEETISVTREGKTRWEFDVDDRYGVLYDTRDNKSYITVKIGRQIWMAENLAYKPTKGTYWAYDNKFSNVEKYGYLYDWKTACDVCPVGWSLPYDSDWDQLINFVGKKPNTKLKAKSGWLKGNGTDEFGYSALPGGFRNSNNIFLSEGYETTWWSKTVTKSDGARRISINGSNEHIGRYAVYKNSGYYVRCIKD